MARHGASGTLSKGGAQTASLLNVSIGRGYDRYSGVDWTLARSDIESNTTFKTSSTERGHDRYPSRTDLG